MGTDRPATDGCRFGTRRAARPEYAAGTGDAGTGKVRHPTGKIHHATGEVNGASGEVHRRIGKDWEEDQRSEVESES